MGDEAALGDGEDLGVFLVDRAAYDGFIGSINSRLLLVRGLLRGRGG
jgi:hypothetical protein